MKTIISALAICTLTACATSYSKATRAQYVGNDTFEISAAGNHHTSEDAIRTYLYRKAFETCAKDGKGFTIMSQQDTTSNRMVSATAGMDGGLNFRSATFPGGRAIVKCEGAVDQRMADEIGQASK